MSFLFNINNNNTFVIKKLSNKKNINCNNNFIFSKGYTEYETNHIGNKNGYYGIKNVKSNIKFEHNYKYHDNNIFIFLTSTPYNIVNEKFDKCVNSLLNQTVFYNKLIINICDDDHFEYNKEQYIDKIQYYKKNNLIEFNFIENNHGNESKFIGIIQKSKQLNINDEKIIIFVNDHQIYSHDLVFYHSLCYQLYFCDGVGCFKNDIFDVNDIIYDNYTKQLSCILSYSIKYKHLSQYLVFYNETCVKHPNIKNCDDILFSIFYKINFIPFVGLNRIIVNTNYPINSKSNTELNEHFDTFKNLLKNFNINFSIYDNEFVFDSTFDNYKNYKHTFKEINYRNYNTASNIYPCMYNNTKLPEYTIHFTYLNNSFVIMTIIIVNNHDNYLNREITIPYIYNKKTYTVNIKINNSCKFSLLLYNTNNDFKYMVSKSNDDFIHFTTMKTNSFGFKKLYTMSSYLMATPHIKFRLFSDDEIYNFVKYNYDDSILELIQSLNVGAYISDFFRALYLYKNGGFYHDDKISLIDYNTLLKLIDDNEYLFVNDLIDKYIWNGFMMCKTKKHKYFHELLYGNDYNKGIIYNIKNKKYCNDPLSITGPGAFVNIIPYNNSLSNNSSQQLHDKDFLHNFISFAKNNNIISRLYFDDYRKTNNDYAKYWFNKNVYK